MQQVKIFRTVLLGSVAMLAVAFNACKKTASPEPLADAGDTYVKFINGLADTAKRHFAGYKLINIDLVTTPQIIEAVDVRRDAANNSQLNQPINITVKNDPGLVTPYDSSLVPLPNDAFTVDAATPLVGTDYQVTMKPGEFSRIIKISITNILALDISKNYALGFTISAVDANGKIAQMEKSIVVQLGLKNKWDGVYRLTGYILRNVPPIDATSTGWVGPKEISLATTGPNSVRYIESHGWANTATIGIAASVANPTYTVASDNSIAITSDGGAFPAGLKEEPSLGNSRYDPATKTFYAYATWSTGPANRAMMDTLVYLRPR